ncbi:MAG: hemerythrin domain-containing protein [Candidatus Thorarchaeota archaeon]
MVLPIGLLMIEHRLIEKMIAVMKKGLEKIKNTEKIDLNFITDIVDFIQIYADRCHHGKEEDILFRELKKKNTSTEHTKIMNELIEEHKFGRQKTKNLIAAKQKYSEGNTESLKEIIALLQELTDFYPKHIEKEDKHFFKPIMSYFTQQELDLLLQKEYQFDQNFIHQVYKDKVAFYQSK